MHFQFTHPFTCCCCSRRWPWVFWFAWKTDVQISGWRRWIAFSIRVFLVLLLVFAIAGFQWLLPIEGMNIFYVLDRSESIPPQQEEMAETFVNRTAKQKIPPIRPGVIVFGSEASIESSPNIAGVSLRKSKPSSAQSARIWLPRFGLGTAAFPENGQKRLVVMTDGNENMGDAMAAVLAGKRLGVIGLGTPDQAARRAAVLDAVEPAGRPMREYVAALRAIWATWQDGTPLRLPRASSTGTP